MVHRKTIVKSQEKNRKYFNFALTLLLCRLIIRNNKLKTKYIGTYIICILFDCHTYLLKFVLVIYYATLNFNNSQSRHSHDNNNI